MRVAPDVGRDVTGEKGLDVEGWCAGWFPPEANRNGRSAEMMTFRVKMTVLPALLLLLAMPQGTAHASRSLDVYLQCDGETRSRLLAFSAGNLETEDQRQADRRLRIEIRNSKRVSVVDLPSGEVLFGPSQCRISTMKLAWRRPTGTIIARCSFLVPAATRCSKAIPRRPTRSRRWWSSVQLRQGDREPLF